jgi:hypothetical protein
VTTSTPSRAITADFSAVIPNLAAFALGTTPAASPHTLALRFFSNLEADGDVVFTADGFTSTITRTVAELLAGIEIKFD